MSTLKQQKVAKTIAEALNSQEIPTATAVLKSSSYAKSTAETKSTKIMRSKGGREALNDLGFTVEGADGVVQKILYHGKKEETRLKAGEMVYKRLGAFAPEKHLNLNIPVPILGGISKEEKSELSTLDRKK